MGRRLARLVLRGDFADRLTFFVKLDGEVSAARQINHHASRYAFVMLNEKGDFIRAHELAPVVNGR